MSYFVTPLTALLAAGESPYSGWLPPRASSAAAEVDAIFAIIFWISTFFFFVIIGTTILFVLKYRKRSWSAPMESPTHSLRLELTWTAIPTILLVVIFVMSTNVYLTLTQPPKDEDVVEIQATAKKWTWRFDYADGISSNELHVVVNQPVLITLAAEDVIHSLYVPAFRVKQDAVPGRYTKLWFKAVEEGVYPLYCAEYCGTNHSTMVTKVVVHADEASMESWRAFLHELKTRPLHEIGKHLTVAKGCVQCHSTDGRRLNGPSFKGIWGKTESLSNGSTVKVDENYIRESIVDPKAKVVSGYAPTMPPSVLEEGEYMALIAYIKSLEDQR